MKAAQNNANSVPKKNKQFINIFDGNKALYRYATEEKEIIPKTTKNFNKVEKKQNIFINNTSKGVSINKIIINIMNGLTKKKHIEKSRNAFDSKGFGQKQKYFNPNVSNSNQTIQQDYILEV